MENKVSVNANVKVVGKESGMTLVETIAIDRRGNEYSTVHNMKSTKSHKKNEMLHVEGHLELSDGINYINPIKIEVLKSEPSDFKMNAWVEGEVTTNFIEPKSLNAPIGEQKAPFGVVSVRTQGRFQRGIVFNNLIATFRQFVKTGAVVFIAGRIQYRSFVNKDGQNQTIAEIICDNNYTKVVKASSLKNPFSFSSGATTQADTKQAQTEEELSF
jgi:hypothetical protein